LELSRIAALRHAPDGGSREFLIGIAERRAGHLTPEGPGMIGDGGYQGTGPITPHKKPPGGELTAKQKAYNSSRRPTTTASTGYAPPSSAPSAI
jgi:hypothetical protein